MYFPFLYPGFIPGVGDTPILKTPGIYGNDGQVMISRGDGTTEWLDLAEVPQHSDDSEDGTSHAPISHHFLSDNDDGDDHPQYLLTNGGRTLTGALQMGGYRINNLGAPVLLTDAANAQYVADELASFAGTTNITTLGTITTGVWHGTPIGVLYGGTGASQAGNGGTNFVVQQQTLGGAYTSAVLTRANIDAALAAGSGADLTFPGSSLTGGNLVLTSTTHGTKGKITLGTVLVVDEVNQRVGICNGTQPASFPRSLFDVYHATGVAGINVDMGTTSQRSEIVLMEQGVATGTIQWRGSTNASLPNFMRVGTNVTAGGLIFMTGAGGSRMVIDSSGFVGIGVSSSVTMTTRLQVAGGSGISAGIIVQDSATDAATKVGRIRVGHYTNAEEPLAMIGGSCSSTVGAVQVGGGVSSENAATLIQFFTAATSTTVTGTEAMRIASTGNIGFGTTTTTYLLNSARTLTDTSGTSALYNSTATLTPATDSSAVFRSLWSSNTFNTVGINFTATGLNGPTTLYCEPRIVNSGTIACVHGLTSYGLILASNAATLGTTTEANAVSVIPISSSGNSVAATVTRAVGLHVYNSVLASLTLTGQAGILIEALTTGTNNSYLVLGQTTVTAGSWCIYAPTANQSYFNGSVSVGTATATGKLTSVTSATDPAGTTYAVYSTNTVTITAASSNNTLALYGEANLNPATFNYTSAIGVRAVVGNAKVIGSGVTGTVTGVMAFNAISQNQAAGIVTNAYGYYCSAHTNSGGGSVTNSYGFHTLDQTVGGTLNVGYSGAITSGTGKYNLYMTGTAQNYLAGLLGVGISVVVAQVHIAGGASGTAWTTSGKAFRVAAQTLTDTSSSGTVALVVSSSFDTPTLAASSTTTYTAASTLYIAAGPTAGTNVTISAGYALHTGASANVRFDGQVAVGSGAAGSAAVFTLSQTYSRNAWGLNGPALRVLTGTLTDSNSSGTVATAVANSIARPTFAAASTTTYTDSAAFYIANAPLAGTNVTQTRSWALWVDDGNVRLDGNLTVGGVVTESGTTGCISLGNGTAPSTGQADTVILYSADISAGVTALHVGVENNKTLRFWQVATYTASNDVTLRTIDANTASLYDTLCYLISVVRDIQSTRIFA